MATTNIDLAQEAREEDRLLQSLGKLQEMYTQLRLLRDTVPSIIRPMRQIQISPEVTYAEFVKAATTAVNNTQDFVTLVRSTACQQALGDARKSQHNDPEDISRWLAEQHHNQWSDLDTAARPKAEHTADIYEAENAANGASLEEALENIKKSNPDASIALNAENQEIEYTLPPPIPIRLTIQPATTEGSNTTYSVACVGSDGKQSKISSAIQQALSQRPKQWDPVETLELVASYSDLTKRKCQKCSRLLDPTAEYPTIRQRSSDLDGTIVALHTSCVED